MGARLFAQSRLALFMALNSNQSAQCRFCDLVDVYYPTAEKLVVVMDNLNTHIPAALYAVFPPAEARRLARKLEVHYTPKHGSPAQHGRN